MKKYILITVILFYISSCNPTPTPLRGENGLMLSPTSTLTTPLPITTPPPTSDGAPWPTLTPPLNQVTNECMEVMLSYDWKGPYQGSLILSSDNNAENLFLDMNTGRKKLAAQNEGFLTRNFVVSPDRRWVAYQQTEISRKEEVLVVQSYDGSKKNTFPENYKEWQSIAYWLNNETLVLWNHFTLPDSIILFNPFSGKKR